MRVRKKFIIYLCLSLLLTFVVMKILAHGCERGRGIIIANTIQSSIQSYYLTKNAYPKSFEQINLRIPYNMKSIKYVKYDDNYELMFSYYNYLYTEHYKITPRAIYEKHILLDKWNNIQNR